MICVQVDTDGSVFVVDPQPADTSACGLVLVSGIEAASSPFSMTTDSAAQIGFAVLSVWAVGYVVRVLARVGDVPNETE